MHNITKEYLLLFNTLTDLQEELQHLRDRMLQAQADAEELFMEGDETEAASDTLASNA